MDDMKKLIEASEKASKSLKIQDLIDSLIFFFKKDGDVFGCDENSRMVFATMKNPDKETGKNWGENASFAAVNLTKSKESGNKIEHIFTIKDISKLKVISEDKLKKELK